MTLRTATSILFLLVLVPLMTGCERNPAEPVTFESLEEEIEYLGGSRVGVGMVVGTIVGGEKRVYSFGSRSLTDMTPPDEDTVFEIGSITKTFTALLLADMSLRGMVGLGDAVNDYLPSGLVTVPSYEGSEITLEHLATHTSGIPGTTEFPFPAGSDVSDPYALVTFEHLYEYLNDYFTPSRLPGSRYDYSNIGMGLLGHVLGLIDGTSYGELLGRVVLEELGMDNTTLFLTTVQRENLAQGHVPVWAGYSAVPGWNANDCFQGAGFIKTSMRDLLVYLDAAMGLTASPLSDAFELAVTPGRTIPRGEIGLGWHILDLPDGQSVTIHDGATGGYTSFLCFAPALATGVIVLNNTAEYQATLDVGVGVMAAFGKY